MNTRSKFIFIIPLLIAKVSFGIFMAALLNGWFGHQQVIAGNSNALIKQPLNTWICFGFIAVGLWVAWLLMRGRFHQYNNRFTQSNFTAIFFSSMIVLIAPAAMSYHATLTHIGSKLDILSINFIAAFMLAYAMQRFFNWKPLRFATMFVLAVILCEMLGDYLQSISFTKHGSYIALAFLIAGAIIFEMLNLFVKKLLHETKWFFYAFVSFIPAFIIFLICRSDSPLCGTQSLIQGHAVWQLLTMLSLFFLFRFYVSEKN